MRVIRIPQHSRRRWLRLILFALFTYASLHLAWVLFTANVKAEAELVGVVSMFAGLWSLAAAVAQFLPPPPPPPDAAEAADQLAATVREQWSDEVEHRQLRDPAVIPLSWAATARPVTAPTETVVGPQAGRVTRLSLDGRLEGDFHRAASQLAAGFRQVPSSRLVVLGEPGAGKTVLAIMLTLGLLADRAPHSPVPVLLSVSGWDPVSESLDDWIVGTLATSYYGGQPQVPRRLLNRRMLLPVLDGLDEIPEAARRNAVRGLNEACGGGRGVVVTCRSVEYQDVIEGGSPPLRRAPVVEVAPVSVPDTIAYLTEVNWPDGVDWEPVYTHLRRHPDGQAATALSTPLALSLARVVYRNCDRDPRELLDFDGRHATEDHLVDHTIPAAYAPRPGTLPQQTDSSWQEESRKAERWLTFLATYLHQHRERDLAWWLMSRRLLSRWTGLLIGIGVGLIFLLAVTAAQKAAHLHQIGWPVWTGVTVAVLVMLTWYGAPDQPPGRISFALRGSLDRLRSGFRTGFALTSLVAVTLLGSAGVLVTADDQWSPTALVFAVRLTAVAVGAATAIGLAFAVRNWFNTPPQHSTRTTPMGLLNQDRSSSVLGAGLAGTVLGITGFPLLCAAASTALIAVLALTGESKMSLTEAASQTAIETGIYDRLLPTLAVTALPGAVLALLILLSRAWPRFALLHLVLAIKGQLPWRYARSLADARERQLLRQSGGQYQFRHIRLQERLASRSLAQDREPVLQTRIVRRRRFQLAAAVSVFATGALLVNQTLTEDTSRTTLPTGNVEAMAFGPPGQHVLITVDDQKIVRRWNTETGEGVTAGRLNAPPVYEGGGIATGEKGAVLLEPKMGSDEPISRAWQVPWNGPARLRSPQLVNGPEPPASKVILSTGGRYLMMATEREDLLARDMGTGKESRVKAPGGVSLEGDLSAVNDGKTLIRSVIRSERDYRTEVRDLKSGELRCAIRGESAMPRIDAHGTRFIATRKKAVLLWDSQCRKMDVSPIKTYDYIDEVALSPDGDQLAATFDGATHLYRLPPPGK